MERFNFIQMYCLADLYIKISFDDKIKRIQFQAEFIIVPSYLVRGLDFNVVLYIMDIKCMKKTKKKIFKVKRASSEVFLRMGD